LRPCRAWCSIKPLLLDPFTGIPREAPPFLAQLAANNRRDWFEEHKADYQTLVEAPLRALVTTLAPAMLAIDPGFTVDPRRGAVSRVRRDTRFSRDKSPYRINQWLTFKRPVEGWQDRPAYFMQFGVTDYAYGMGFYQATPATMTTLRDSIRRAPERFAAAVAAAETMRLEGERYHRPKPADGLPAVAADWFSRKSVYLIAEQPIDELFFTAALAERLAAVFGALAPLYRFLDEAVVGS